MPVRLLNSSLSSIKHFNNFFLWIYIFLYANLSSFGDFPRLLKHRRGPSPSSVNNLNLLLCLIQTMSNAVILPWIIEMSHHKFGFTMTFQIYSRSKYTTLTHYWKAQFSVCVLRVQALSYKVKRMKNGLNNSHIRSAVFHNSLEKVISCRSNAVKMSFPICNKLLHKFPGETSINILKIALKLNMDTRI